MVGEVTRGVTAREEYEQVARDIRFGFYKEVILLCSCYVCVYICINFILYHTYSPFKYARHRSHTLSSIHPPPPTYTQAMHDFRCPAILLGHHQGDVQENVLSNAMRGVGPMHLSGMGQARLLVGWLCLSKQMCSVWVGGRVGWYACMCVCVTNTLT